MAESWLPDAAVAALVTALGGLAGHHHVTWIAHAMTDGDVEAMATETVPGLTPALAEVSRDGHPYRLRLRRPAR